MNFIPIAERELRIASRKPSTYFYRSFIAFCVALLGLIVVMAGFGGAVSPAEAGRAIFATIGALLYFGATLDGAVTCAGSLNREKRDNTLGLLFLTPLKGYDVILGKLISCILGSFYVMIATLPVMAFCFFLGGMAASDFLRMMVALPNTLFFSAAVGLLVATCVRGDRVFAVALSLIVILTVAIPLFGAIHTTTSKFDFVCLMLNPGGAFLAAMASVFTKVPASVFLWSIVSSQTMAWGFLFLAGFILRKKINADSPEEPRSAKADSTRTDVSRKTELHTMLLQTGENRAAPAIIFLFGTVALLLITVMLINPLTWFTPENLSAAAIAMAVVLHLIVKYLAADHACRALIHRRQSGELELLLTTPMDADEIVRGNLLALKRRLLWPVLFVLFTDLILLIASWYRLGGWDGLAWAAAFFVEILWMLMNIYALCWVGLCQSMRAKSIAQALRRTLVSVILIPWAGTLVCIALAALMTTGRIFHAEMGPFALFLFVVWLLGCNVGYTGWAINELRDRFRLLALQQELSNSSFTLRRFLPSRAKN